MKMSKVAALGLIMVALIITLGGILFTQALYAADYAVDGGNATQSTNTTLTIGGAESTWFWGLAVLIFILVIAMIFLGYKWR
jgi:hypothetical protein